jgi:hypothetical protein
VTPSLFGDSYPLSAIGYQLGSPGFSNLGYHL